MVTVMLLRMVLYAPILAIGGVIMIARTNLSMGWIVIVAVLAIALILVMLIKVAMPKFKIMQKLIDRVNLVSREMLMGLSVVRAFNREQHEEERFDEASTRLMKTQLFTNRVMTFMMPLMMLIMNLVSVGILLDGHHHGLPHDRHALDYASARRCRGPAHRGSARMRALDLRSRPRYF